MATHEKAYTSRASGGTFGAVEVPDAVIPAACFLELLSTSQEHRSQSLDAVHLSGWGERLLPAFYSTVGNGGGGATASTTTGGTLWDDVMIDPDSIHEYLEAPGASTHLPRLKTAIDKGPLEGQRKDSPPAQGPTASPGHATASTSVPSAPTAAVLRRCTGKQRLPSWTHRDYRRRRLLTRRVQLRIRPHPRRRLPWPTARSGLHPSPASTGPVMPRRTARASQRISETRRRRRAPRDIRPSPNRPSRTW